MTWHAYAIYAGVVGSGGIIALLWLQRVIRLAEAHRANRVERIKRFDAIRTDSPIDDPTAEARERGIESITTRFAIMRRALLPGLALTIVLLLGLPLLTGAPATIVSLLVAVVAVIVGIAAKPLLENLFAGIVISFSQPIRIGDTVLIDGKYGTIEDISITHTTVKIWDWRRYMVPNHQMIAKEFINYSIIDRYQWAYVEFWVAPESDLEQVRDIAIASAQSSRYYAGYEEPRFWIMELAKEGVRCWIAAWASSPTAAWQLMHEVRTELVQRLHIAGIRTHAYRYQLDPIQSAPFTPTAQTTFTTPATPPPVAETSAVEEMPAYVPHES